MSREAGIDFDLLVEAFKGDEPAEALARRFEVSEDTIISLQEHFNHYGLSSVMGGD